MAQLYSLEGDDDVEFAAHFVDETQVATVILYGLE